jgi:hypothetical protein
VRQVTLEDTHLFTMASSLSATATLHEINNEYRCRVRRSTAGCLPEPIWIVSVEVKVQFQIDLVFEPTRTEMANL